MGRSTISVKLLLILTVGGVCLTGCGQATSTSTAKAADSTTNNSTTTVPTTTAIPAPATEPPPPTTPPTATAPKPTAAAATEPPPPTTPPPAAPEPPKAPQAGPEYFFDSYGSRYAAFKSPSGGITCDIHNDAADCIVVENSWNDIPPDEGCDATWGLSVAVSDGEGIFTCRGDATAQGPVLPYGYEIEFGPFLCHSKETGVTCDNQETGHGFKVNRASFDLY